MTSEPNTAVRQAAVVRRILAGAFLGGLAGVGLAFVGERVGSGALGEAGALIVLGAVCVAVVATPFGFVMSILAMRTRWRRLTGRPASDDELRRP